MLALTYGSKCISINKYIYIVSEIDVATSPTINILHGVMQLH